MGPHNAALISKSGRAVLLIEPEWDADRAARLSWIDDVRGTADFTRSIPELMGELTMTGKVGIAGMREMSAPVYECIREKAETEGRKEILTRNGQA